MKLKTLSPEEILQILAEAGVCKEIPEPLRTKIQDAHDTMGFYIGVWDENGKVIREIEKPLV